MSEITLFRAKKIITMDRNRPEATHVAVRGGVILAVGGADCAEPWGEARLDDRFAGRVMLPGLVEAHAHVMTGGIWRFVYCGHYIRTDPQGVDWPGLGTTDAVVERLTGVEARMGGNTPLIGWGFDPNSVTGPRLDRALLDRVSRSRPVVVLHSNLHMLSANSAALALGGLAQGGPEVGSVEGILRGADGLPTGELQEFAAMGPVMQATGVDFAELSNSAEAVRDYGRVARLCGVTTVADLLSELHEGEVDMLLNVTGAADFPVRYVPMMNAMVGDPEAEARRAVALRDRSTDKLRLGGAKLFTDGSIQSNTAKLKAPGYLTGEDQGIWNMEPDHFRAVMIALHRAGVQTHIHTNGDEASEFATDVIEEAMRLAPGADHRHTLEHVQLADRAQFKRMRNLRICVNLFANHLYYFGDVHWSRTVGPDRASRMDACGDALEVFGGDFAIHSDAPVTPMAPLFTAWCAVNRLSQSGRRLGEAQRIPVADALRTITLGAAYVLKMEGEIGSIQTGKRGDFCLLEDDPLAVPPEALKDIPVAGTVLGGQPTGDA